MTLNKKKVVVIGGSSGIGLAVAKLSLEQGASVVIASRNEERLKQAQASLGGAVQIEQVDLLDESSVERFMDRVGEMDHLQLTAAEVKFGDIDALPVEDAKASFESKFWGPYLAVKHGHHRVAKDGSITLYSGAASQRPNKDSVILTALNSAVEGFSNALAVSLSPVRVNVISPGITLTPLFENMGQEVVDQVLEMYQDQLLIKRYGQAEEVAKTALYLMENAYVTGSLQMVNGGMNVG